MRGNPSVSPLIPLTAVLALATTVFAAPTPAAAAEYRLILIDGQPVRWPRDAEGRTRLTYAIATSELSTKNAINCGRIGPPQALAAHSGLTLEAISDVTASAFARWSQVSHFDFVQTDDQTKADIVIGEQMEPAGRAFTNLTFSDVDGGGRRIASSQICLNPRHKWKVGFDGNLAVYDLEHTIAHEIGHALGLDHPVGRDQIMSFRYHERTPGLGTGDVAGLGALYGEAQQAAAAARFGSRTPRPASSQALR